MKKPSAIDNYNQSLSWHKDLSKNKKTKKHEEEEEEANKCKDINTNN